MPLHVFAGLVYVFGPALPDVEKVPVRGPGLDHRIVRLQSERLLDQASRFLIRLAFHAESQWDRQQQKARRPVTLASLRLALDVQDDRVDPRDDARRDQFVQAVQVAQRDVEPLAPNGLSLTRQVQKPDSNLKLLSAAGDGAIHDVV